MNVIDFVAAMGRRLFAGEADAAASIKAHIEEENPGIRNLGVAFDKGFVTLSGDADTWDAVEKAMLMAGNVEGVGKVVSNIVVGGQAASGGGQVFPANSEYYEVKKGDTLSGIAQRFYGKAADYPKIFEANREVIKDPDKIFVGQKIRIPTS
jgi:nucleoid-associated protein YgaU